MTKADLAIQTGVLVSHLGAPTPSLGEIRKWRRSPPGSEKLAWEGTLVRVVCGLGSASKVSSRCWSNSLTPVVDPDLSSLQGWNRAKGFGEYRKRVLLWTY